MTLYAPDAELLPTMAPRRLVIVVRADPVICGHSGEARNLAEAAMQRGFSEVRIVTWPLEALTDLPLKPMDSVLPYSEGITVERPEPVGDYKIPDGRYISGLVGRLVELFTDDVPTVCLSLYLTPHANVVIEAMSVALRMGKLMPVTTIAEAVGSDITNVVRSCLESGRLGAAAHVFSTYLSHDHVVAVSAYTKFLIVDAAAQVDAELGTDFASQCEERVGVSYPAVNSAAFVAPDPELTAARLAKRGLSRDGYVLFLSRVTAAKGVDDLIRGYAASGVHRTKRLVIAGTGKEVEAMRELATSTEVADRISFFTDVDDDEKVALMEGCSAYVLPSKPRPEFVETFGIALVEKMLAGGGPVLTTETGGIPEAVGDTALTIEAGNPSSIAAALDGAILRTSGAERAAHAERAREHALQFDRLAVFDRLFDRVLLDTAV